MTQTRHLKRDRTNWKRSFSIRSERKVRLAIADSPPDLQLEADAYLYDLKTQTMKEKD